MASSKKLPVMQKLLYFRNHAKPGTSLGACIPQYSCGTLQNGLLRERFNNSGGIRHRTGIGTYTYTLKLVLDEANFTGTKFQLRSIAVEAVNHANSETIGLVYETTPYYIPGPDADPLNLRRLCRDNGGTLPEGYDNCLRIISGLVNYIGDLGLKIRDGFEPAHFQRGLGLGNSYLSFLFKKFLEDPLQVWLRHGDTLAIIKKIACKAPAKAAALRLLMETSEVYANVTLEGSFFENLEATEYTTGLKRSFSTEHILGEATPDARFPLFGSLFALQYEQSVEYFFPKVWSDKSDPDITEAFTFQLEMGGTFSIEAVPRVQLVIEQLGLLDSAFVVYDINDKWISSDDGSVFITFPFHGKELARRVALFVIESYDHD